MNRRAWLLAFLAAVVVSLLAEPFFSHSGQAADDASIPSECGSAFIPDGDYLWVLYSGYRDRRRARGYYTELWRVDTRDMGLKKFQINRAGAQKPLFEGDETRVWRRGPEGLWFSDFRGQLWTVRVTKTGEATAERFAPDIVKATTAESQDVVIGDDFIVSERRVALSGSRGLFVVDRATHKVWKPTEERIQSFCRREGRLIVQTKGGVFLADVEAPEPQLREVTVRAGRNWAAEVPKGSPLLWSASSRRVLAVVDATTAVAFSLADLGLEMDPAPLERVSDATWFKDRIWLAMNWQVMSLDPDRRLAELYTGMGESWRFIAQEGVLWCGSARIMERDGKIDLSVVRCDAGAAQPVRMIPRQPFGRVEWFRDARERATGTEGARQ